tara:strand:+ start:2388 stop:3164 length:777 start_codon:yes stop_codon:yes gene_type:complete
MTSTATLLAAPGERTTRAAIETMSVLAPQGPSHRPRAHLEVLEGVEDALDHHGLEIIDEALSVSGKGGTRLLGTLRVRPKRLDHSAAHALRAEADWSLAFRSSQDRSWGLRMCSGLHILACSNGLLEGSDGTILTKRHCKRLNLQRNLRDAIEHYIERQVDLVEATDRARERTITDTDAKTLICDAFSSEKVNISPRLFREVVSTYFCPHESWTDVTAHRGSAWGLHNSFTRALRQTAPNTRYRVTRALAYLLDPPLN